MLNRQSKKKYLEVANIKVKNLQDEMLRLKKKKSKDCSSKIWIWNRKSEIVRRIKITRQIREMSRKKI